MTRITLCYGLPASGKSTWAKALVEVSNGRIVRVNMDDIRTMLGFGFNSTIPWSKSLEEVALNVQDKAILAAVASGRDVIVDNTHIEKNMPKRIKRLFDGEIDFRVKDFSNVSVQTCAARDVIRKNAGEAFVGSEVLTRMASRMKNSKWKLTEEWMNDIHLSKPYVRDRTKPKAILVDIDGTLAKHVARGPYDYSRVLTDVPHEHIVTLVNRHYEDGYYVILLSGRPDIDNVCEDTVTWLDQYDISFDRLYMRPSDMLGDNDADVKQFLFDMYIRDYYDIEFMLDDRNRVVRRMRKLNIPVLQVADGNF